MSANEGGFTLVEILVSLAIFAVVVIGALGVLGAAGAGGFLEGFPTGFVATRAARDTTAAAVYLQAFQEYTAGQTSAVLTAGTYCDGADCTSTSPSVSTPISSSGLTLYPTPPGQPYQLNWRRLDMTVERWYACLNTSGIPATCTLTTPCFVKYSATSGGGCTIDTTKEYVVHLHSRLTWRSWRDPNMTRTMDVDRFLP